MRAAALLAVLVTLATTASAQGKRTPSRTPSRAPERSTATQVTARITPELIGVGEPITVELRVRAPLGSEVRFPALPDSVEAVEPLDPREVRDASSATMLDRTAVYRLIAWDTGQRVVAFSDVTVSRDGAETRYPVRLPALRVRSVLPPEAAKRVPRKALDLLVIGGGWWRLIVALAVILPIAWFAWRAWRRRSAEREARGPDASLLAGDAFMHASRLGLLEAGEHGRFALTHVDVMRRYLAARFPQAGPSRTSREVAESLVGSEFPILPDRVAQLLLRSEPIAFARAPVSADEARGIAAEAKAIVKEVEMAWRHRKQSDKKVRRRPL